MMFEKLDNYLGRNFFQPFADRKWAKKNVPAIELSMRCDIHANIIYIIAFSFIAYVMNFIFIVFAIFSFMRVVSVGKVLHASNSEQLAQEWAKKSEAIRKIGKTARMFNLIAFVALTGAAVYMLNPVVMLVAIASFFFLCSSYLAACVPPESKEIAKLK